MTNPDELIVNLQKITKTHPKGIVALKDINLTISKQEIISIVGANGSGKSTLLKRSSVSLKSEKVSIAIFNINALKHAEKIKKINYIGQDWALDLEMTGKELLYYFSALCGLTTYATRQRCIELINIFELISFIEGRVNSYFGGQTQRLHLALFITSIII